MDDTKISIIIPVFNSQEFIEESLASLSTQTHQNIEIICVNDGSRDNSLTILESFAAADSRIKVISQENKGVSVARNTGIEHSTGQIIMFVDADDTLASHACERVAAIFNEHKPEIITFGLACDPPEAAPASLRRELTPGDKVYNGFQPNLLFKDHARPYACRSALSREFVVRENVHFEPGIALGEDQVFYFATYPFSRKTILSSETLYIYRMNPESATHVSIRNHRALTKKLDQHLMVIEAILHLWDKRGMNEFCSKELLEWILDFLMLDISRLPPEDQRTMYARLMSSLDDFFPTHIKNHAKRIPTKWCLADIQNALETPDGRSKQPVVSNAHLNIYYLMRRGFIRCAERLLMKAGVIR